MWRKRKILLPVVCAVFLVLSTLGALTASGGITMPWRDKPNGVEQILQRDGYLEGVWYPWFGHENLGHGLTSNELMVKYVSETWGDVGFEQYGATNIYREIYNLKALGFNIMGYEGSAYGEGVIYDDYGQVLGIKEEYLTNVRKFLDVCRAAEMPVLWTVCFHTTTVNDYYEDGKYVWDVVSQAYVNPEVTKQYTENFVKPLCQVLAEYPDVVVMVAAGSEMENETNDSSLGNQFAGNRVLYGVNVEQMAHFVKQVNETIAQELPDVTRTICVSPSSTNTGDMVMYRDTDFDMLGRQIYNGSARSVPIEDSKSDVPMLVTEFGLGNDPMEDSLYTIMQTRFRDNFRADGYKGWFYWCWQPNVYGSGYSLLSADGTCNTDFRPFAYALHYYVEEYRNEHRGVETVLDAPVLFCNTGSGLVQWIASRQATALDLKRSTDGGQTWTTLLDGVSPADYENDFKGVYEDVEIAQRTTGGKVMYQLVAYDDDGHRVESKVSNEADIVGPPVDLMVNGSFENGLNNWTEWGKNGEDFSATAVEMEDAPEGENVLDLKYTGREWFGLYAQGIKVKPNTNYKITYQYKLAKDATATSSYCYIRGVDATGQGNGTGDINDGKLAAAWLNHGNTETWTTEEIIFRTNDSDIIGVDFRVIKGVHFYIDSVTLTEIR